MPFFDFHIHPVLKCFFSDEGPGLNDHKLSPWVKIDDRYIPKLLKWCSDFEYILQSQGNLAQLCNNDCNFICVALYYPEKEILAAKLVGDGSQGPLGIYLQPGKLQTLINGNPYGLLESDDWVTLTDAAKFDITDRKVKPLKTKSDYNESDTNTVHAVFSVEGCHTLTSALQHFDVNEVLTNLDDLRSKVSLLSLNLTHMENSPFCNQAFGMQFLPSDGFKPMGNGISADGITILKHCYENKIMIDIKHMSLIARQQLYAVRNTGEYAAINQPVICTHAGFTGISIKEIKDYVWTKDNYSATCIVVKQGKPKKYGENLKPSFNASSINLYDEDIIEILQSGGMIGLSLDKRILGFQDYEEDSESRDDYPFEVEYIANAELTAFLGGPGEIIIRQAFDDDKCLGWEDIQSGAPMNALLPKYHLTYFMAHILHVIVVARKNGYDAATALTQVCIGADFDGLINPIWCCATADELLYMQQAFEQAFVPFANESNVPLPGGFDVKEFSQKLFFENGRNFVLARLDILNA